MKKELSPTHEMVACDVCGRTILKGEHTEPYLVPDGTRRLVCDLCTRRAESAGWRRESQHGDMPTAMPRAEPRRSLLSRLRQRFTENGPAGGSGALEHEPAYEHGDWGGHEPALGQEDASYGREADAYGHEGDAYGQDADPDRVRGEAAYGYEGPADRAPPARPRRHEPEPAYRDDRQPAYEAEAVDERAPIPDERAAVEEPELRGEPAPLGGNPVAGRPQPVEEAPSGEGRAPLDEPEALESLPPGDELLSGEPPPDSLAERRGRRHRRRLRDPRHVRAVPTGAEAKVERALELFNLSEHRRTVGGLVRTLGEPWVTARPHEDSASEVTVVVAWELSWYQYRVDLSDAEEAVGLADKGHEIDEIDAELRRWNATATDDGALVPGAPEA